MSGLPPIRLAMHLRAPHSSQVDFRLTYPRGALLSRLDHGPRLWHRSARVERTTADAQRDGLGRVLPRQRTTCASGLISPADERAVCSSICAGADAPAHGVVDQRPHECLCWTCSPADVVGSSRARHCFGCAGFR